MRKKVFAVMLSLGIAVSSLTLGNVLAADTSSTATDSDTHLSGQVTAVSGNSITLNLYAQPSGDAPSGDNDDGNTTPPSGTPPTDTQSAADSSTGTTPTPPSDDAQGGSGKSMTLSGETKTITLSDSTAITKNENGQSVSATVSDITVGCTLSVTVSDDTVTAVAIMPEMPQNTGSTAGTQPSNTLSATPCSSAISVDGTSVSFQAYTIGGYNYFKLRDLAEALNGSGKQFEIGYDSATSSITMTSGTAYTPVGGELSGAAGTANVNAKASNVSVYLDGTKLSLTAYNIADNNYFKLRDIASAVNFGVTYDSTTGNIGIDTTSAYTA